jgi:hypothetical protein
MFRYIHVNIANVAQVRGHEKGAPASISVAGSSLKVSSYANAVDVQQDAPPGLGPTISSALFGSTANASTALSISAQLRTGVLVNRS